MTTREFTYLSADREHRIHAVEWQPQSMAGDGGTGDRRPRAVLQIIHGMCEYKERYAAFAEYLCSHGFVVVMHDQLGHGDTARSEKEFGLFTRDIAEHHPKRILLADVHRLCIMTQKKYPGIPYYILGHSMGSYELRTYLSDYADRIALTGRAAGKETRTAEEAGAAAEISLSGAVIMGTGYVAPATTAGALILLRLIAAWKGWAYRSRLIRKISTGSGPYKRYDTFGKDPDRSWLCKDRKIVTAYHANPKSRFIFTLNGYEGLLSFVLESCKKKNIRNIPAALPLLLVSGSEDPVGDMGRGVRRLYTLLRKTGHDRIALRLFAGDRHEILNETDRMEVNKYLLGWMKAQM